MKGDKKEQNKKKLPPGVRERDGRYTYRYSVEVVVDGKRRRKQKETHSYPSAKEAYDAGIEIESSRINGKLIDIKTISLEKWGERWLEDYELEREPRINTIQNRKVALNAISKRIGKETRLKDITGDDYQKFLNQLKKEGRKKGTIQQYHASLSIMFSDAVRKKIIADDPTSEAKVPVFKQTLEQIESGEEDLPEYFEKKELLQLLQFIRFRGHPQEYNIFLTLAYTGLRIGELLALKVGDFDEDNKIIKITKTLTVTKSVKDFKVGPPKNKSSIRKVTIGDTVIKALKSQISWRNAKMKEKNIINDNGFIFHSVMFPGYPASSVYLARRFDELCEFAGLSSSLTPHSLRHTHVSLLAEAGEQLAVIQERLGHKNDDITKRIYLHVTQGQKKATPDRFEKIMQM